MVNPDQKLGLYQGLVAKAFPLKVQDALRMIDKPDLQLLALRRYIRKATGLDAQWVWSDQQINAYENSPAFARVRVEIDKVRKTFEELNPGYTLGVSPIRDLARQVALWNANHTVRTAATDLQRRCRDEVIGYPERPDHSAVQKFRTFLGHCPVRPEPTSAAPGLSDHGQMHAIDFVVMKGHSKVADTRTASIGTQWDAPGWTQKLQDAVRLSKSAFKGPLSHPREPWHYTLPH
jgi:hypothetical protein